MSGLKRALRRGETRSAVWLFTSDVDSADILGSMGFDAIVLDREHAPSGLQTTLAQLRAVRSAGDSSVLVRIRRDALGEVGVLLDMGVDGLLLADARSALDVRALIDATRYAPSGSRGAHMTVSRAARWGAHADAYLSRYADDLLLIAMIESVEGAQSILEIGAVDGLDMVFVGPLDLSASVGVMGDWDSSDYRSALRSIEEASRRSGLLLGGAAVSPGDIGDWSELGYRMISIGSDVSFLRTAAADALDGFSRSVRRVEEKGWAR